MRPGLQVRVGVSECVRNEALTYSSSGLAYFGGGCLRHGALQATCKLTHILACESILACETMQWMPFSQSVRQRASKRREGGGEGEGEKEE
jgi:hypothetical protein